MPLITAETCINLVIPAKNMDEGLLTDSIGLAELKYVKKALGAAFYEQLLSENQSQTFTGLNQTLLEKYVRPLLARYVIYEALPLMKAEIVSQGIQTHRTEYGLPATDADFGLLRSKMLSDAELLLAETQAYIKANVSQFPLYECPKNISNKTLPYLY